MSTEFTFVVEKTCPVCGENTRVVKVKSRLAATQVDDDYCCHYRDFNPYLYNIWVCEHCSFAADEKVFLSAMPEVYKNRIKKVLGEKHVHFQFQEERSVPDGIASMQLALFCAETIHASLARQAGMTLRLAWVYRIDGNKEKEEEYIKKALALYLRSFQIEHYPIDSLTDNMVMYLIGALYAHLGQREQAVVYLSRLLDSKNSGMLDDKLARDARRLWQSVREDAPESGHEGSSSETKASKPAEKKETAPAKKKKGLSRWF